MKSANAVDILILSNGPGEIATWVRPVVKTLRQRLGNDRDRLRISVVLSPCPNATGKEAIVAHSYPEVDRVQAAENFFPFLLWGKTLEQWDWRKQGIVLFLGGDQFFPLVIGKRLGYRTVIYAEWEARWTAWIDRFGVMKPETLKQIPSKYADKFTVVGDLMAEVSQLQHGTQLAGTLPWSLAADEELIGCLPGSKPAKLTQGVPLLLAIAEQIQSVRPKTRFVIPVAPMLDLATLASFADPQKNPILPLVGGISAELVPGTADQLPYLRTAKGTRLELWTESPAYQLLTQCRLCLTTVGANTAELGSLAVPMMVLLPTQQLDAMRAWDGLPGLLANLPGVGTSFARLINGWALRRIGLLAWPNIWAKAEIVPELVGKLDPQVVAEQAIALLNHPEKLQAMSEKLRQVRGQPGAAEKLVDLVCQEIFR